VSVPGPQDTLRVELDNGIVVLARANDAAPAVSLSGYLPAGGLADPDEKLGLADFTAAALMRGVQGRTFRQIHAALEGVGASLGLGAGTHHASFSGKALSEDLPLVLDLLADALIRPVFPDEQVERLRAQLLTGLAIRAQDTAEMAGLTFDELVYAGHPYRRPDDGYPETIQAIQLADLADFHRRYYGPRGLVIAIVGAVEPHQAVQAAAAALGGWRNPQQTFLPELPPLAPLTETVRRKVVIPGKSQSDVEVGAAGPPRASPDFMAAALGNNILGQFGMMGRVGQAVREDAGLAYYAGSSLSGGSGPGAWDVSAGVDPENVDEAIDLIVDEIERFCSEPVTAEELADSQSNFIGRLPLSLESNSGVAAALLNLEQYRLGLDYYQHYAERVRAVTTEDVLAAAQRYLNPERLGIAVAGS
jgi:zinc protease